MCVCVFKNTKRGENYLKEYCITCVFSYVRVGYIRGFIGFVSSFVKIKKCAICKNSERLNISLLKNERSVFFFLLLYIIYDEMICLENTQYPPLLDVSCNFTLTCSYTANVFSLFPDSISIYIWPTTSIQCDLEERQNPVVFEQLRLTGRAQKPR